VAWELRERIRRNQLPNGSRLRLVEIMDEWGLSPTEARSAMALLGRLGIVRQQSGGGAVVYRPTRAQIEESWRVRGALEALAAEEAARRIDRSQLDLLEGVLKEMRGMRPRNQLRYLLVVDPAFHDVINGAAGMHRLQRLVAEARVAADIGMVLVTKEQVEDGETVPDAHATILETLVAHDAQAVTKVLRTHYDTRRKYWLDAWDEGTRDEVKVERVRGT
jgi:DNA-binding GntR family transcriptional regulator